MNVRIFTPGKIDTAHDFCPVPGSHTYSACNYFRAELAKYGQHLPGCTLGAKDCSCGLLQALDARSLAATHTSESAPPKDQGAGAAPPAAPLDLEGLLLDIREHARTSMGDRGYEYIEDAADAALVILKERQPAAGPPSPALAQPPAPQEVEWRVDARKLLASFDAQSQSKLMRVYPALFPPAEPSAPQAVAAPPIEKQLSGTDLVTCLGKPEPHERGYLCRSPSSVPAPPAPVSAPQAKRHKCMRCHGEFECPVVWCQAKYDVLPPTDESIHKCAPQRPTRCTNFCPPTWTGRWRDWHRGHGCDLDPEANPANPFWPPPSGEPPARPPDAAPQVLGKEGE